MGECELSKVGIFDPVPQRRTSEQRTKVSNHGLRHAAAPEWMDGPESWGEWGDWVSTTACANHITGSCMQDDNCHSVISVGQGW